MSRSIVLACLLGGSLVVTAACDNGAVGIDDPGPLENVLCQADITVSGTFQSSIMPAPTGAMGCVPDGTWTITATVPSNGDCSSVAVAAQYVVNVVDLTPGGERPTRDVQLQTPPAGAEVEGAVHAGGNGECQMSLDIITPAPTVGQFHLIALRPYFEAVDGASRMLLPGTDSSFQLWKKHP